MALRSSKTWAQLDLNVVIRQITLITMLCSLSKKSGGLYFHVLSRSRTVYLSVGESVTLDCEFYADSFNLFDNPILWRKRQLNEDTQMNMMGNLVEPFTSERRFQVSFQLRPPRYLFSISITDIKDVDCGSYTCELFGPQNALLGNVTHEIHVKALISDIILQASHNISNNNTDSIESWFDEYHPSPSHLELLLTEGIPSRISCEAEGGYPPVGVRVEIGDRDISGELEMWHGARMIGRRGLRVIRYRTARASLSFKVDPSEDGKVVKCSANTLDGFENSTEAKLVVNHAPVIHCYAGTASLGDQNAQVRCEVKARPWVTSLYWVLDNNGTILGGGKILSDYWTLVMDRPDGILETQLFLRKVTSESFRSYTLLAENSVGTRSQQAILHQTGFASRESPSYDQASRRKQSRNSAEENFEASFLSASSHKERRNTFSKLHNASTLLLVIVFVGQYLLLGFIRPEVVPHFVPRYYRTLKF